MTKYNTFLDTVIQDQILEMPREKLETLAINIAYNDFLVTSNKLALESYEISCFSRNGNNGPPQELPLSTKLYNKWYNFIRQYIPKETLQKGQEDLFKILEQPSEYDPISAECDVFIEETPLLLKPLPIIARKIIGDKRFNEFIKNYEKLTATY